MKWIYFLGFFIVSSNYCFSQSNHLFVDIVKDSSSGKDSSYYDLTLINISDSTVGVVYNIAFGWLNGSKVALTDYFSQGKYSFEYTAADTLIDTDPGTFPLDADILFTYKRLKTRIAVPNRNRAQFLMIKYVVFKNFCREEFVSVMDQHPNTWIYKYRRDSVLVKLE